MIELNYREQIINHLRESARVVNQTSNLTPDIIKACSIISQSFKEGGKLITAGNGGSAADAQHAAAELVGTYKLKNRRALPAICITSTDAVLTAISNDLGYDKSFSRQIEAYANPEDVFLAISTSGNSKNILDAVAYARRIGTQTIALTGLNGRKLASIANLSLIVPSEDPQHIQEAHGVIIHAICSIVEQQISQYE